MALDRRLPKMAAGITHTETLYAGRTADTLPEPAKRYRDAFVREYIKDFNGPAALARLGAVYDSYSTYRSRSGQLLREPYVANLLWETVRKLRPQDVVARQEVMARMWEEANDASNDGKDRVKALAHIANMLGMTQKQDTGLAAPGVMLVPVISVADWGQTAAMSQAMLKAQAQADAEAV